MDRTPITDTKELEGKTISEVLMSSWGGRLIIRFEDGSFTAFVAENGYSYDAGPELDFDYYPEKDDLYEVGVLTEEEYQIVKDEREDTQKRIRQQEFEKLKKEFGD